MSYPINVLLIPGLPKLPYAHGVGAYEGVVNHSTATPEATDEAIRNFEAKNWNSAFVQFAVDWDSITQIADYNYTAWGAGPKANPRFVHIELCETSDAAKFQASYDRYVWLTAWLLSKKNLGVSDAGTLWSHAEVTKNLGGTTHTDPIAYFASHGLSWAQHVANVRAKYNELIGAPIQAQPAPATSTVVIGKVAPLVSDLNIRTGPGTNYPSVGKAIKGHTYPVYANVNDWHNVGPNQWMFGNNGQYLTLVRDEAPQAAPVSSGIKSVGTIRVVGVSNAAIVMDKPDRVHAANIGTLPLGTKISISGSVPGYWEVIYRGRRAYITAKFGVRI